MQKFSFSDSYGKTAVGQLSDSSYKYILKKVNETMLEKSNQMKYCPRQYISLKTVKNGNAIEKKSCIGSVTKVAKKMAALANSLELLL